MDGARVELAFHGCRPWVIPLYEPPVWGDRSESNRLKRVSQTRPAPFGFGHSWSWSSESNTRRRGTSSLHFHCARPANLGAGTQPRTAVGAYHAPALPVELCQRSWRGDSNADHGLTRPALFPLSYTSEKLWRRWGELHSRVSALQADVLLS